MKIVCCTLYTSALRTHVIVCRVLKIAFLFLFVTLVRSAPVHSAQARPVLRTVWDGVYVHPQADRGESNFYMHCAQCHQGARNGGLLSSEDFFNHWRGETLSALFRYMKATMPPDNPASLSDWEYLDIITYILQINGYAEGSTDLLPSHLDGILLVGSDGIQPLPPGTSVYAVGCLNQGENGWILTSASRPSRSRTLPETEQSFKTLGTQPLGSDKVRLEGSFDGVGNIGAKVYVKGSLIHRGESVIDVSAFRVLNPQCDPPAAK